MTIRFTLPCQKGIQCVWMPIESQDEGKCTAASMARMYQPHSLMSCISSHILVTQPFWYDTSAIFPPCILQKEVPDPKLYH